MYEEDRIFVPISMYPNNTRMLRLNSVQPTQKKLSSSDGPDASSFVERSDHTNVNFEDLDP